MKIRKAFSEEVAFEQVPEDAEAQVGREGQGFPREGAADEGRHGCGKEKPSAQGSE